MSVNTRKYTGFCVYRRSYLLWPPLIEGGEVLHFFLRFLARGRIYPSDIRELFFSFRKYNPINLYPTPGRLFIGVQNATMVLIISQKRKEKKSVPTILG